MNKITSLVRWVCKKLTFNELLLAVQILLEVLCDEREDIKPRNYFQEQHPKYRKFTVDPLPPLIKQPLLKPKKNWKELLALHLQTHGKNLTPVKRRRGSQLPPPGTRCETCNAPEHYLYVNDGKKASQLLCKICGDLFASNRIRLVNKTKYWCPYCGRALYKWKADQVRTIFKCGNKQCSCYQKNLNTLNDKERKLQETGMSSQFKLCYQYREYHFTPAQLRPVQPEYLPYKLDRIRNHLSVVGLVLAYSISFGLSGRMTAQVLKRIHNIQISHQTVMNYLEASAVLAHQFNQQYKGEMSDSKISADETYIRVMDQWNYTWFVVGARSRAIWSWHISDDRGVLPALITLKQAMRTATNFNKKTVELIGDGNPSYDAAVHAFNQNSTDNSLKRIKVIGLRNEDAESEKYREFKQIVERLNRTYKFHTRARSGFKNKNGAVCLTALFVAYYNFLRPHYSLKTATPLNVPELKNVETLQGQWLKLLQMAA